MNKKFYTQYPLSKKKYQLNDIIDLKKYNFNTNYSDRFKGYTYNIKDENIHKLIYYNKLNKCNFFYFNKFKKINFTDLKYLPLDTYFFITYEIVGTSFFAKTENNKLFIFNKYNEYFNENVIDDYFKVEYISNKYTDYILEFKIYENELYLINMFNNFEIKNREYIYKISNLFDVKIPKLVNTNLTSFDEKMLDMFYNDYLLDVNILIEKRNYYFTFMFKNNKYLLYKI